MYEGSAVAFMPQGPEGHDHPAAAAILPFLCQNRRLRWNALLTKLDMQTKVVIERRRERMSAL